MFCADGAANGLRKVGRGSDIYVFEAAEGMICQRCSMAQGKEFIANTRSGMIEHMKAHRLAGDRVPEDAFEDLHADLAKEGDAI